MNTPELDLKRGPIAVLKPTNLQCVCLQRDLGELLAEARRWGWRTAGAVAGATGCGSECGSCRPYIARMLATGQSPTTADLMDETERERWETIAEAVDQPPV